MLPSLAGLTDLNSVLTKFNLSEKQATFQPLWNKLLQCEDTKQILDLVYSNFVGELLKHAIPKVFILNALSEQRGVPDSIQNYRLTILAYIAEEVSDSVKSGRYSTDTELLATIALW